jgi:hypothetical protein
MKKLMMSIAVLAFIGTANIQAQSCGSAAKTVSADKEKTSCTAKAAAKLASASTDIEAKVCDESGKVSYVRNTTCEKSGKTAATEVKYCDESKAFVNVSPSQSSAEKSCSSKSGAKAVQTSVAGEKKANCTKDKTSCTGDKKSKSSASSGL